MPRDNTFGDAGSRARLVDGPAAGWVDPGQPGRRFETNGWRAGMLRANGIAHLAEVTWHHPDLQISWGHVDVALRTDSADAFGEPHPEPDGLTEKRVAGQPDAGSALKGVPARDKLQGTMALPRQGLTVSGGSYASFDARVA